MKQLNLVYLNLMLVILTPKVENWLQKHYINSATLRYLRMTGNKFENEGGMCFAGMLQINSSLEKWYRSDCGLEMQKVVAFAIVLTENQTTKGIYLNLPILYGE